MREAKLVLGQIRATANDQSLRVGIPALTARRVERNAFSLERIDDQIADANGCLACAAEQDTLLRQFAAAQPQG